jgi:hypothetical protein
MEPTLGEMVAAHTGEAVIGRASVHGFKRRAAARHLPSGSRRAGGHHINLSHSIRYILTHWCRPLCSSDVKNELKKSRPWLTTL